MKSILLDEHGGLRTFAIVFDTGDEPVEGLKRFAREHQVSAAQLTAIGAFRTVTVGYFHWQQKDYQRITLDEQVEVLTLIGNIGVKGDEPALHVHVVVGRADGTAHGGHLLEAKVRPTLEVLAIETPGYLRRRFDPDTGLSLIDVST